MPQSREKLPGLLQQGGYDWVAVTSPEAAAVLIEGWEKAGKPQVGNDAGDVDVARSQRRHV
jgi:uroporphyrinogen-III synthase